MNATQQSAVNAARVRQVEESTPIACTCRKLQSDAHRRYWRVTLRRGRIDAKGRQCEAPLSTVRCFKCQGEWRSRADWIEDMEDASGTELAAGVLGANSYKVKHWTGAEEIVRATFYEDDDPCFHLVERPGYYYAELDREWSTVPDAGDEPDDYCSWRWWVYHFYDTSARKIAKLQYDGEDLRKGKLRGFGVAFSLGDKYHEATTLRGLLVQVAYSEG